MNGKVDAALTSFLFEKPSTYCPPALALKLNPSETSEKLYLFQGFQAAMHFPRSVMIEQGKPEASGLTNLQLEVAKFAQVTRDSNPEISRIAVCNENDSALSIWF